MSLFGPHIHRPGMGLDLLERGQFAAALAMDVDSDYIRRAREKSPGTVLAVRVYEDGANFLDWSPQDWVGRLLAKFPTDKPDFVVTINEPFGHDSSELFEPFDIWESEVIRLLQANGTDGLALNFGTGNFTGAPDRVRIPDVFPRICEVANAMGPHDYDWPDLQHDWNWRGGRWFKWYDDILEATGREMRFLIGECGLTQAIIAGRPDHGWQSGGPEGVTAESYLATLHWYLEQVVNWDAGRGIVLGLCLFNWYDQYHHSFEHINRPEVVDAIVAMDVPAPPPPEPPPNGGENVIPDRVKVYDFDHGPGDEETVSKEWLESIFGPCIKYHPITEIYTPAIGDVVYELEWINCKPATVSVVTIIKDVYGEAEIGEGVVFGWRTADPHGLEDRPWNWTENGAVGWTEPPDGHVGPAMSVDSYYSPDKGECGPHFLWIWGRPGPMIDGIGLLPFHDDVPGANHLHVEFGFRAKTWGDEPPEPPEPPTDGDLVAAVNQVGDELGRIGDELAGIRGWLEGKPPEPPEPPPPTFKGHYFNNITLSGTPTLIRDDPEINFNWGSGSPAPGKISADNFSVRWTGKRTFEARAYTFHALTDDGFRLWVDGELLIDAWKLQAPTPYQAVKTMTAGQHDIKVEYFERGGGATCKLWWE